MTRKQKRKLFEARVDLMEKSLRYILDNPYFMPTFMHIRKTCKEKLKNYTGVKLCPTCGSKVAVVGKTSKYFVPMDEVGG